MSCERCVESAASGAKVCGFCGEPLEAQSLPEMRAATPRPGSAVPAEPSDEHEPGPAMSVLTFVAGFFLTLLLMMVGARVGSAAVGSAADIIGAIVGGLAGSVLMILVAKWSGDQAMAAGGITAVAMVVIVFGGCLMMLST